MRYLGKREANYYDVKEEDRIIHNNLYLDRALLKYKEYFDRLFNEVDPVICLDEEQRRAILIDEDYEIVVAGAGSGKTTTMVGKVKFLVECLHVEPESILLISYTNKAVEELHHHLCDCFKLSIEVGTFHHVALKILKEITNINYQIEADGINIISHFIYKYLPEHPTLCKLFNQIFADYFHYSAKYMRVLEGIKEYVYSGGNARIVVDQEIDMWYNFAEKYQCKLNFNVRFEEKFYFCSLQYHEMIFYIDYFQQQVSLWEKIRNYHHIYTKTKFHKQHHSYYFALYQGDQLEDTFLSYCKTQGISIQPPTILSTFLSYTSEFALCQSFISLIYNFLMLWKKEGKKKISRYNKTADECVFLDFMDKVASYYQQQLDKKYALDFEDVIQQCTVKMNRKNYKFPSYVLVDEYQDISEDRFRFLKRLCQLGNAKLIVVGDDWQSIYRFSGSHINLFTSFQKQFKYSRCISITKTYRNSQQLIDISGNFVMKNPKQLKKKLTSSKNISHPIYYSNYKNIKEKKKCLKNILKHIYDSNPKDRVLILSRFHFDFHFLKEDKMFEMNKDKLVYKPYPSLSITCLTIHASKGLGFDQVILLNNEEGEYGFPSLKEIDPYLNLLQNITQQDSLLEERRLFYVALTRTKKHVYLLVSRDHPSIFVKELKKEKSIIPL